MLETVQFSLFLRVFFQVQLYSDSKIGTPVATLSGAWCYRVSAGPG